MPASVAKSRGETANENAAAEATTILGRLMQSNAVRVGAFRMQWRKGADSLGSLGWVALAQGDARGAWEWLQSCEGRVASRPRWDQLAANTLIALDRPGEHHTGGDETQLQRGHAWQPVPFGFTNVACASPSLTPRFLVAARS